MLKHIGEHPPNEKVKVSFLYSTKPPVPEPYMSVLSTLPPEDFQLFVTRDGEITQSHHHRRMRASDVKEVIEKSPEDKTLVYICGPQGFTDEFVDAIEKDIGFSRDRLLTEKWW